jgi:hypothetical protein
MPSGVAAFFEDSTLQLGALAAIAVSALIGLTVWLRRKHPTEEELEKSRRLSVSRQGRVADGLVLEVHDHVIEYSYTVRGIEYSAAQDLRALEQLLPSERHRLIGTVNLKYMEDNPANSIVLSEEWSGLRVVVPKVVQKEMPPVTHEQPGV